MALPACEAWIVQVPGWASVAVVPEIVQIAGVSEVKLTGRTEVAIAVSVNGVPCNWLAGSLKVMV